MMLKLFAGFDTITAMRNFEAEPSAWDDIFTSFVVDYRWIEIRLRCIEQLQNLLLLASHPEIPHPTLKLSSYTCH
jgi:hypothetical protein